MSIFVCQSERYESALALFDPLADSSLIDLFDPAPKRSGGASLPWFRIVGTMSVLFLPLIICSIIPTITFGGRALGVGGLISDAGIYGYIVFGCGSLILIPIGRRLLGILIDELVVLGVVSGTLREFSPKTAARGPALPVLEWVSRVNGPRLGIWFTICLLLNLNACYGNLADGRLNWTTSHTTAHTLFFHFRIGIEQPNLAGLWLFVVIGPVMGCLVVIAGRLLVVFACLCAQVAENDGLHIMPSHPDKTGGLKAVGQVALFFAMFSFLVGLSLAGITANEIVMQQITHITSSLNDIALPVMWGSYFVLGLVLFFLPLVPLRKRMAQAKRAYLVQANRLRITAEIAYQRDLEGRHFRPDTVEGLVALDALSESAAAMAVWPFDRKTFVRYAGLLISPIAPLIAGQLPNIFRWLGTYLTRPR